MMLPTLWGSPYVMCQLFCQLNKRECSHRPSFNTRIWCLLLGMGLHLIRCLLWLRVILFRPLFPTKIVVESSVAGSNRIQLRQTMLIGLVLYSKSYKKGSPIGRTMTRVLTQTSMVVSYFSRCHHTNGGSRHSTPHSTLSTHQ